MTAARPGKARRALPWGLALALGVAGLGIGIGLAVGRRDSADGPRCGGGFVPGPNARCCEGPSPAGGCTTRAPAPTRVAIPNAAFSLVASDWEASYQVDPLAVMTAPFWIDAYELTAEDPTDPARAAGDLSVGEARARCRARGGRLPTSAEWVAAAAYRPSSGAGARTGQPPETITKASRYPWGETGAVCRRAAFGLVHGPCAEVATAGPDTVGAHPDGATAAGLYDVAGNVAEWVDGVNGPELRGGSYATSFAADLRLWAVTHSPTGGVRCAYDAPR